MARKVRSRIVNGDAQESLKRLPDDHVNLIVSSPPYNLGKPYEKRTHVREYLRNQRRILRECVRVLKPGGSIFWQVGSTSDKVTWLPLDVFVFPMLLGLGLRAVNRIVWVRSHGVHAARRFSMRYETILWFSKPPRRHYFNVNPVRVPQLYPNKKAWTGPRKGALTCHPNGKNPGDVWAFSTIKHNHEERTIHPCQFPEGLVARIILSTTRRGDVVLDPYSGSGTVPKVAKDLGRRYIGIEIRSRYCELAKRRLTGKPNSKGAFPNLKNLRDYAERLSVDPAAFRFDLQNGKAATLSSTSVMVPEPLLLRRYLAEPHAKTHAR